MPENLFDDQDSQDRQLSRRFFNRRSEGGSGIVDITVTAAPAFLASKLDVLRYFQGENLYWLTDMEKDLTRWHQSRSQTLREASDILDSISQHADTLHNVGSRPQHSALWHKISAALPVVSDGVRQRRVLSLALLQTFASTRRFNSYTQFGRQAKLSLQQLFSHLSLNVTRKEEVTNNPRLPAALKVRDMCNRRYGANYWLISGPRDPISNSAMLVNFCHAFLVPHPALAAKDSKCLPTCQSYAPLIDPFAKTKPDTSNEYHEYFWSTCAHILGCVKKFMRHNAVLRSAIKEVLLHYFGFTSWTEDLSALAVGFGKHADAQLTFNSDYQCMSIVSGQTDRTRPLLIDISIVNTGCITNVDRAKYTDGLRSMLRQAEEKKLKHYKNTAEAAGLEFLPLVFGSDGSFGELFVSKLLNPWKQRRLAEVLHSPDPWENEWTVHREAKQIALTIGCEIARQNGRMVEQTLDFHRKHTRSEPYSMQAWLWGEDVDYDRMERLDSTRQDMIADYKTSRAVQIARYRRNARYSTCI